ncbi:MAG: InlB B-repeat-containing protein, partial [Firmicutes bacterium]|nr:InlB B-repeat-containing protein [Bacillota bacterium]
VWKLKNFTVTFDTVNGYSAPAPQTVTYGNKAAVPTTPDDYYGQYVKNWHTSSDTSSKTNIFDFDTAIKEDITLYAEWTNIKSLVSPINGTYVVYYGDTVTVRGSINKTWEWLAMVDGKEILTNTLLNYQCIISAKSVVAGKTAVVASYDGRNSYTTYLKYVYKQGDIDGDGDVDGTDAALYLKHLNGDAAYRLTTEQLKRADMNYDGSYDMLDVVAILAKIA